MIHKSYVIFFPSLSSLDKEIEEDAKEDSEKHDSKAKKENSRNYHHRILGR